ncbi:hypothetical protein SLEP1_g50091 [Rubroshorea leprosula]|uniref:Integrase catalytic domain-containing protein n=1 Tax=Rubroshorea leprosula TaxID=152421 RepID=A0AAV5LYW5_9ROSI|nr:hypothetical protein SLEP1_g50091 [Rubroshorea leprosula]
MDHSRIITFPNGERDYDLDQVCEILKKEYSSDDKVVEALNGCEVSVSNNLIKKVLKRFDNDWIPAFGVFTWAKSQTGYEHPPELIEKFGVSRDGEAIAVLMATLVKGNALHSVDHAYQVFIEFKELIHATATTAKMASKTFVQPAIPRFDGHYDHWSMLMENFLRSKEYWNVVEFGVAEPTTGMSEAQKGETVTDYFSRTMAIVNKLRTHGDKTQDVTVVEKILCSMTPKYNVVVCVIEEANDLDEMSLDELKSSLLVHERKLNRQDKEELALKVSTDHYSSTPHKANKGRGRGNMDRRSHQTQSYDSQGKGRGCGKFHSAIYKPKSVDKSTVQCYRCHRMFLLHLKTPGQTCFSTRLNDVAWPWHFRYGHLNFGGLKTLQQRTMVIGLPEFNSPSDVCEECVGIKRQITAAYTPQQNGVCERKNRTILDMVRSLLTRSCIPKNFWPEAINWSIHILNRSPTFVVKDMTPKEAWSERKPTVDHFRIYGCVAYAHVPDQKRKKLDNKGEKCIFLGVSDPPKAYKLYNPSTKKIVISRDVVFDEEQIWPGSKNGTSKCISVDFDGGDDEEKQQSIENVQQQLDMDEQQQSEMNEQQSASTSNALEDAQSPTAAKEDEQRPQRVRKRPAWMTDYEKAIGVKWVDKTKLKENGQIEKFKARLVAKGYKQEFGIDYKEVYALVARHDTICLVIALVAHNSWPFYQLDVKSAFLHGDLDEEVFIHQPPGYVKAGNEHKVYKLKRALYGLKQAPRAWYSRIESYFLREGFEKCPYEHTLFIKSEDGKMLIVCLYVDDLIYIRNDMVMFDKFKKSMMAKFEMSDLRLMHYYLGIEVNQSAVGLKLVKNPGGKEINNTLYKQIVGSLMYLTATRPDIMHAISLISRYMDCPKEVHLLVAKRILRYLQGTAEYGLFYKNGEKSKFFEFTNGDFVRDLDDRKSTSGYVFIMGTTAISWTSRKQSIVTLSTTKAEFVAATTCACQAIWLRKVLEELQSIPLFGPFYSTIPLISICFDILINGFCKAKKLEDAKNIMDEMEKHGYQPNVASYTSFIEAYYREKDLSKVDAVLDEMQEKGCKPNIVTYTLVMIAQYRLHGARKIFENMERHNIKPNVWTYNAMISYACAHSREEEALKWLQKMEEDSCKPDRLTCSPLLHLCFRKNRMKVLNFLLNHTFKNDLSIDLGIYALLVSGFCKSGKPELACSYLKEMVLKGMVPYQSIYKVLVMELDERNVVETEQWIENLMVQAEEGKQSVLGV